MPLSYASKPAGIWESHTEIITKHRNFLGDGIMRRSAMVILALAAALSMGYRTPRAAAVSSPPPGNYRPVWTPDGTTLLFFRNADVGGTEGPHIFSVLDDGSRLRPLNPGAGRFAFSSDSRSWLIAQVELWVMPADRYDSLRLVWRPPSGHALIDARFGSQSSYWALASAAGFCHFFEIDHQGRIIRTRPVIEGRKFAWSPSTRWIAARSEAGLAAAPLDGSSEPRQLAGPGFSDFGFVSGYGERLFLVRDGSVAILDPDQVPARLEEPPAGFSLDRDRYRPSPPDWAGYAGPLTFISPGPAGQLLAGDGASLRSLSPATGRTNVLAKCRPEGRASWHPNRETAVFCADGKLMVYHGRTGTLDSIGSGKDPVFSPDGRRLAFWRLRDGIAEIAIQPFGGTSKAGSVLGHGRYPVWLGLDTITYLNSGTAGSRIVIRNLKSGSVSPLPVPSFWTLQVAAVSNSAEAADFVRGLAGSPLPVFVEEVDLKGTRWYRVRAGIFHTKDEAEKAFASLEPMLDSMAEWTGTYLVTPVAPRFGGLSAVPDGSLVVFDSMGIIYAFDRSRGSLRMLWRPLHPSPDSVRDIAVAPDGRRLAFIDDAGRLNVLRIADGQVRIIVDTPGR